MAMGLHSTRRGRGSRRAPMAEINVTPLVDVMLVLMIIFMITAPLLTHAVRIDMPEASSS
ncbi:MAG: biopolymer transporter ExbD, partial [Sphingomonadaceae bacterium]|nr:biopolymer transporter ExbD [Sphingomonadaceae bacterium]